ncbi:MAG: orotidine-5'-phosphate decarboxylase [Candidatus Wildermuthbacteria bacterium]|nr:orotidine-5'-phosphate decarboxylase [Candidatus Wildermuthbacteria bacterium]
MLEVQWAKGNFVCVGLDSEFAKIPDFVHQGGNSKGATIIAFNRAIVEVTEDIVCAYKLNSAFYEAHGDEGIVALQQTIAHIHAIAPSVPVILDAKRGDIGTTNAGYVEAAFGFLRADAITVSPYLGAEALRPFLERAEKGIIVLCRTSNPGAGEFQDLLVSGEPLYRLVARCVASEWNKNGNCALVVGATYPDELREVRELIGDMPILIPGIGAQGGDVKAVVSAGQDSRGHGMIINSSRRIIFASRGPDFAESARQETEKLRDIINQCRENI